MGVVGYMNRTLCSVDDNAETFKCYILIQNLSEMNTSSRPKSKLSGTLASPKNNNFSQKYFLYTRERKFLTPKKQSHQRSDSKDSLSKKDVLVKFQKKPVNLTGYQKTPNININMEIKNLTIFGNNSNLPNDSKKKKLHKKTISALGKPQKETNEKEPKLRHSPKKLKHTKTRSQENIKMSPTEWGKILAQHVKSKNSDSINLISKYAVCNRKGMAVDKKDKINQDTYILIQNFMIKDRYLFGVCDGHGVNGHFVSEFIKEILPENIEYCLIKNKALKKSIRNVVENSLREAFLKTSSQLEESGIDINFSGSTACLLYLHDNIMFCSNLGDSRAVIFSRVAQKWQPKSLSFDHKAEDEREACRIKMNGGRIFPYFDQDGEAMGPYRIWIKEKNIPGLAMTRSFGDYVASTVGVISQPQVTYFEINQDDKFMVVASDGLWEFITNEEVLDLVTPAFIRNNADEAVHILQQKAVEAWRREDENIDDITIQVIFFKYY